MGATALLALLGVLACLASSNDKDTNICANVALGVFLSQQAVSWAMLDDAALQFGAAAGFDALAIVLVCAMCKECAAAWGLILISSIMIGVNLLQGLFWLIFSAEGFTDYLQIMITAQGALFIALTVLGVADAQGAAVRKLRGCVDRLSTRVLSQKTAGR